MSFKLFISHVYFFVSLAFLVGDTHAKQLNGFDLIAMRNPVCLEKQTTI